MIRAKLARRWLKYLSTQELKGYLERRTFDEAMQGLYGNMIKLMKRYF